MALLDPAFLEPNVRVLSGRQPWWWAILEAGKDVENRVWTTSYRGPIVLHAASGCTAKEWDFAIGFMKEHGLLEGEPPPRTTVPYGGVCGVARIVDVLPQTAEPSRRWHMAGQFGFVLEGVQRIPFLALRGGLGLRRVDAFEVKLKGHLHRLVHHGW